MTKNEAATQCFDVHSIHHEKIIIINPSTGERVNITPNGTSLKGVYFKSTELAQEFIFNNWKNNQPSIENSNKTIINRRGFFNENDFVLFYFKFAICFIFWLMTLFILAYILSFCDLNFNWALGFPVGLTIVMFTKRTHYGLLIMMVSSLITIQIATSWKNISIDNLPNPYLMVESKMEELNAIVNKNNGK